jgi:hypothetical protein
MNFYLSKGLGSAVKTFTEVTAGGGNYITLLDLTGKSATGIMIDANLNAAIKIGIGGVDLLYFLDGTRQLMLDGGANKIRITGIIQVKYVGSAPTAGNIAIAARGITGI